MKIGNLYQIKQSFWFLYPEKENIERAIQTNLLISFCDEELEAERWSKKWNVSFLSQKCIFTLLDKDIKQSSLLKILTLDGKIGWIIVTKNFIQYFEELKNF